MSQGFPKQHTEDDIRSLRGGRVYFHKAKGQRSYFGGQIVDIQQCRWQDSGYPYLEHVDEEEKEQIRQDRYHIEFIPDRDGKNKKWEGKLKYGVNTIVGEVVEVSKKPAPLD